MRIIRLLNVILVLHLTAFLLMTPFATPTLNASPTIKQSNLSTIAGAWTSVGPSSEQNCDGNIPRDIGYICSGRITAIAPDPAHPGTIYIGGAVGGVWKTINGGSTWTPLTDNQPSLATGSIALDSNGSVLVGTGQGDQECGSYYGAGILKSSDGGATWVQLGASTFGKSGFRKLIVNPTNPNVILAALGSGFITSSAGSVCLNVSPGVPLGIYISKDGGTTWTNSLTGGCCGSDVILDPTNASIAYASIFTGSGGQIYKSTDGGSTWNGPIGGGLPGLGVVGPVRFAVAATSHLTVYAALGTTNGYSQLYRSMDGGTSWSNLTSSLPSVGLTGFCFAGCANAMYVEVDPTDANTVYLGGLDIWRSTDGASTWTDITNAAGAGVHVDQHSFAFDPSSHTTIYVGNDGGIWKATNANTCSPSACWTDLNSGLGITQFVALTTHPTSASLYFGGTQDNGANQHTGTNTTWTTLLPGDAGFTAYDRNNPSTLYVQNFETVQRSDDGGRTWTLKINGISQADDVAGSVYPPMAQDPNSPTTLYWGSVHLYKTTNRADNWTLLSPGIALSSGILSAIKIATTNNQTIYTGTTMGQVFRSTDGGTHFTEIDSGLPARLVTKIAIDSNNAQRVVVTFSDFGGKHVFLTTNSGTTWTDITSSLPDYPANSVLIDAAGTIYVGTDIGVFVTQDSGATWSTLGTGLPRSPVFELAKTADGTLLAATYGRSVWALSFDFIMSNGGPKSVIKGHSVTNTISVTMAGPSSSTVSLSCTGLPAKITCTSFNPATAYPSYTSTLTISTQSSLSTGVYTITVTGTGGGKTHTTQFTLTVTSH